MPSKILYDTRTLEILRCQPKAQGIDLPSLNGLCKSARIPEDGKIFMADIYINDDMLTSEAKERLELVVLENEIQAIRKTQQEALSFSQSKIKEKEQQVRKKQLREDFVSALLEEDEEKATQIKNEYKQLINTIEETIK